MLSVLTLKSCSLSFLFLQVQKHELPTAALLKEYPQIKGFHFVSSTEGVVMYKTCVHKVS